MIKCKCGYEHSDMSEIIMHRDPILNKRRPTCAKCGYRIFFKTVSPSEYKRARSISQKSS